MTIDPHTSHLFVCDIGNNRIVEYDNHQRYVRQFMSYTAALSLYPSSASPMAVALTNDTLFVGFSGYGAAFDRVSGLQLDVNYTQQPSLPTSSSVFSMAVHPAGDEVVLGWQGALSAGSLMRYDVSTGAYLGNLSIAAAAGGRGTTRSPISILFDAAGTLLYVTDNTALFVVSYPSGVLVASYSTLNGTAPWTFIRQLLWSADGQQLLALDMDNGRIYSLSPSNASLAVAPSLSITPLAVKCMAVEPSGSIWLGYLPLPIRSPFGAFRYDPTVTTVTASINIDGSLTAAAPLISSAGMVRYNGMYYAGPQLSGPADPQPPNVLYRLDSLFRPVDTIRWYQGSGSGAGDQQHVVSGLAVTPTGQFFAIESRGTSLPTALHGFNASGWGLGSAMPDVGGSGRLGVGSSGVVAVDPVSGQLYVGNWSSVIKASSSSSTAPPVSFTTSAPALSPPSGLCVDWQASVYAGDSQNARIVKFDSTGNVVLIFTHQNLTSLQQSAIAVDALQQLYVAASWDSGGPILKFAADGTLVGAVALASNFGRLGVRSMLVDDDGQGSLVVTESDRVLVFPNITSWTPSGNNIPSSVSSSSSSSSSTGSGSASASSTGVNGRSVSSVSAGVVAGIIIGSLAGSVLFVIVPMCLFLRRQTEERRSVERGLGIGMDEQVVAAAEQRGGGGADDGDERSQPLLAAS